LLPPSGNNGSKDQSIENTLSDIYRYYWLRGLWKFVVAELGHLVIMTWLVLFCIFLGTCVDYRGISSFDGGHHHNITFAATPTGETSVWRYIHFERMSVMSWYFVVALVIYSIYGAWRLFKFFRDLRRLVRVRVFYRDVMEISDFKLRTARWADMLKRLAQVPANSFEFLRVRDPLRMQQICQQPKVIAALIGKRENAFKRMLELGLVNFVLEFPTSRLRCWADNIEINMLTRGFQWNLMHCVVNFFFDSDTHLRSLSEPPQLQVSRLKKRVMVLGIVNILLLPFLVVFVALYAIFRYGEQFYKDPSSVGARQWSSTARWYFRDYNEMPHVFEERLRLSSRFAKHYTRQFAAGSLEGAARAAAFVLGSIVVWLLTLSLINEHVLLSLDISPGKSVLWWITVLSGGWVVCRSLLQSQHVFYPADALRTVHDLVRHLPPHFIENPGGRTVLRQFYQLFPLRVVLLLQEFAGLLITPWILLRRVYPNAQQIVETFRNNTHYDEFRGHYFATKDLEEGEEEDIPIDTDQILQSVHLVPYLQNLDSAALRVEESI
jgi:autophagy-related protein 9